VRKEWGIARRRMRGTSCISCATNRFSFWVNDHSPKPLYYPFQVEYGAQLSWDDMEQGPEPWRIWIGCVGQ
jgi:hypothetical protein